MKGKRTLIFNALMLGVGLLGLNVEAVEVNQWADAFVVVWGAGNVFFRAITNTPMFKKE